MGDCMVLWRGGRTSSSLFALCVCIFIFLSLSACLYCECSSSITLLHFQFLRVTLILSLLLFPEIYSYATSSPPVYLLMLRP